jgi:hypothetical protein
VAGIARLGIKGKWRNGEKEENQKAKGKNKRRQERQSKTRFFHPSARSPLTSPISPFTLFTVSPF